MKLSDIPARVIRHDANPQKLRKRNQDQHILARQRCKTRLMKDLRLARNKRIYRYWAVYTVLP